eukprot:7733160-Pyramimonas_sp.AAC.1
MLNLAARHAGVRYYGPGKCSVAVMAPTLAQGVVVSGCRPPGVAQRSGLACADYADLLTAA